MHPIKDIVARVMDQMSSHSFLGDIQASWERISQDKYSRVVALKEGCLTVSAQNSLCLVRLNLNREKLLKDIRKEFPSVTKINFKAGM